MAEDSAQRLQNDLNAVMEKVYLCREIMLVSPGIQEDETLAGVIGFLEACRDRCVSLLFHFVPKHQKIAYFFSFSLFILEWATLSRRGHRVNWARSCSKRLCLLMML